MLIYELESDVLRVESRHGKNRQLFHFGFNNFSIRTRRSRARRRDFSAVLYQP